MLRVGICHKKLLTRACLRAYCTDYFSARGIVFAIKEYISGESLLLEDFPDVLFLGIEMGQIDGILVKEILEKLRANTRIIFVAEPQRRVFEAFGKNVYGYLKEPIVYRAFREKITEVVWDYLEQQRMIYCKCGKQIERISLLEVLYVESYGKYTKIYQQDRPEYLLCDKCMGDWVIEQEDGGFLWCHRKFLVNILHIQQIRRESIELVNGVSIPFSRYRYQDCCNVYQNFLAHIHNYDKKNGTLYFHIKTELGYFGDDGRIG